MVTGGPLGWYVYFICFIDICSSFRLIDFAAGILYLASVKEKIII